MKTKKKSTEKKKKKKKALKIKKVLKMTSQLVIFRAFFFRSPTLNLKKISRKSTNKKNLALYSITNTKDSTRRVKFVMTQTTTFFLPLPKDKS